MEATTAEIITAVGTLLAGLGTLGLLAVASQGLTAWRQQMVGQEEYDVAKAIIKTLLDANDFVKTFEIEWKIDKGRLKLDQLELFGKYTKVSDRIKNACADAIILWGHNWYQNDMDRLEELLYRMGQGSMENCDQENVRRNYISDAKKEIERLTIKLREVALGRRTVQ
jgi:hypothetical protein